MIFDRNQTAFQSPFQKEVWQYGCHIMPLEVSLADVSDEETHAACLQIYACIMEIVTDMYTHPEAYTQSPRWYTGDYLVWLTNAAKPQKKQAEEYKRYLEKIPQFGFVYNEVTGEWSNPRYPLFFAYYPRMAKLAKDRKQNLGGYLARLDFRLFAPKIILTLDDVLHPLSDLEREQLLSMHSFALSRGFKMQIKDPYTVRYLYNKLYSLEIINRPFSIRVIYRLDNGKYIPDQLERYLDVVERQADSDALISYIQGGICACNACNGARPFNKRCGVWVMIRGARRLTSMMCRPAISKYRRGSNNTRYTAEDMHMLKRLLEVRMVQVDAFQNAQ